MQCSRDGTRVERMKTEKAVANIVLNRARFTSYIVVLAAVLVGGCADDVPPPPMPLNVHCGEPMLFFSAGAAELSETEHRRLAQYVGREVCQINPDPTRTRRLIVTGHADKSGSEVANEQLGMRRAQYVASGLIELGVAREYICVRSKGSTSPLGTGVEPQNRFVRIAADFPASSRQEPCPAGTFPPAGT